MQYSPQNITYFNGTPYINNLPQQTRGAMALNPMYANATMPGLNEDMFSKALKLGLLTPLQQSQPAQQPAPQPLPTQSIQPQLNRLTQQANNALYGGLTGYNQNMPMQSGGSNPQTFAAPTGNFRDAFAGMQGLLGSR